VSVGYPSTGGLWVAEYDTTILEPEEDWNIVPFDTARLLLARTMDDKCKILQDHFRARLLQNVELYWGHAFLNSWKVKETGEVGPLK
jgi:hypothetical protein